MVLKQEMLVEGRLGSIRAFKFECLENLPAFLRQDRPCHPSLVTSYPQTHQCFSKIFKSIAILIC